MSFLSPLMLAGLVGALIPVLIHLIHRRKPRRQLFAAIEFVLRSVERVENRWRLRRFLLLASRVLLIAFVALAAAKPIFGRRNLEALTRGGPERLAIVIDASLSMRQLHADRSAYARALTAARNLIDRMGPEDQAVLVFADDPPVSFPESPTADRNRLLAHLDRSEPGYRHVDLAPAVSLAAGLIALSEERSSEPKDVLAPTGRLVLLSDMAGHAFRAAADLGPASQRPSVEIVNVLDGVSAEARANRAITELSLASIPASRARTMEARSRVRSFPGGEHQARSVSPVSITLHGVEGELERGSLEISPGAVMDKSLTHAFEATGHLPVRTQLEPDTLREDDVRYEIADVRRPVRTLIVDGAPSGVPKEGEVFYLERALLAGARDQPAPRFVTMDDLHRIELADFDVLMMVGVASIPTDDAARIIAFVEGGGGLLISTTRDLDADGYNRVLAPVLPRLLRGLKEVGAEAVGSTGPVSLALPSGPPHAVLEIFEEEALDGLTSARTHAYFLLEPARNKSATVLLAFDDGQPALLESAPGKGRVLLWTTTLDRDLSDFVIRPAFVPLIRRALLYLGRALSPSESRTITLGERHTITLPHGTRHVEVVAPDGATKRFDFASDHEGSELVFADANMPGPHRVRVGALGTMEEDDALTFAVNVDPRESDLRAITAQEAMAVLEGEPGSGAERSMPTLAQLADTPFSRPEAIAMLLLILACLAFLGEGLLTAERRTEP